jgi:hypothetical protein
MIYLFFGLLICYIYLSILIIIMAVRRQTVGPCARGGHGWRYTTPQAPAPYSIDLNLLLAFTVHAFVTSR